MKELKVFQTQQECAYHYTGIVSFANLLEVTGDYPYDEEVMEKAELQKESLHAPFWATLRISPDAVITELEDETVFAFEEYEIRDGRSKCAALGLLDAKNREDGFVKLHIFALEKEKMELL